MPRRGPPALLEVWPGAHPLVLRRQDAAEAEVPNLDLAIGGHEEVWGAQVAVDEVAVVEVPGSNQGREGPLFAVGAGFKQGGESGARRGVERWAMWALTGLQRTCQHPAMPSGPGRTGIDV